MSAPELHSLRSVTRTSISDHAAAILRRALQNRELADPLPGEHQLSVRLGISRPSVRAAIAQLAAEGLVVTQQGRRSRLVPQALSGSPISTRLVCLVSPMPLHKIRRDRHSILVEMHLHLANLGIGWEQVFDAKLGTGDPAHRLERLVSGRRHVCWILLAATPLMQQWFARVRLPVLVLGSCAADAQLPSVDHNYQAIGQHAAAETFRRGHRHAALVVPDKPLPGDRACRDAFHNCFKKAGGVVSIVECAEVGEPVNFRQHLTRLLNNPLRPTAILSMRVHATLPLITHTLASGFRIPQDVSIVLRDTHPLFETGLPEFTRYNNSDNHLARRAVRLASALLSGRKVSAKSSLLMPTFIRGATLADLRRG